MKISLWLVTESFFFHFALLVLFPFALKLYVKLTDSSFTILVFTEQKFGSFTVAARNLL